MDKNIRTEFNKIFDKKVNEEFCYLETTEFVNYLKTIIKNLKNNNFCFNFETDTDEKEYQFSGYLNDIKINDSEIKLLGDFKKTCHKDNKQDVLLVPLNEIKEGSKVKLVFNPAPWLADVLKQNLPETTNIIFTQKIVEDNPNDYYFKKYELTFYFNLKEMLSDLIIGKNMARKIEFPKESDAINFFKNIKKYLMGKTFHYWVGENVATPILDINIITEEDKNVIKITTEYGEETVYAQYIQGIQESDNFLHFNQRPWDGSEYKISL